MSITRFRGDYYFLSNMYPCTIYISTLSTTFKSSESAFQACKCKDREDFKKFIPMDGFQAKAYSKVIKKEGKQWENWDNIKLSIMKSLIAIKFSEGSELAQRLLNTGDAELIEVNSWGDTFWGVCNEVGENHLGNLLMERREELGE